MDDTADTSRRQTDRTNINQRGQAVQQNQNIAFQRDNMTLAELRKQRHERIVRGLSYSAIAALFYTLYNRHQSKKEIEEQYFKIINNTQSESERIYLENETFLERETSQFTILQLTLMTFAFMLILHLLKRVIDFKERNYWTSWYNSQMTADEYERQTEAFTQQEVQRLQTDANYRQFERERDQWREAERRMRDQGEQENDENLQELMQNEDDSSFLENEFEKIDRHQDRVRQRLRPRAANSDISVQSQTFNRANSELNPVQLQTNASARPSMGPPTTQSQILQRTTSRAERDSASQSSRRSSQRFN